MKIFKERTRPKPNRFDRIFKELSDFIIFEYDVSDWKTGFALITLMKILLW